MLIKTLQIILIRIFCKILIDSLSIATSIIDPDFNFQRNFSMNKLNLKMAPDMTLV